MAGNPYEDFFRDPASPRHRQYECLRARFVEGWPLQEIAERFGLTFNTVQSRVRDFKAAVDKGETPAFFLESKTGPKSDRKKPLVRDHVVRLRAKRYSDQDIYLALQRAGFAVSVALIDQVLREEGLGAMGKRTQEERDRIAEEIRSGQIPGLTIPPPESPRKPEIADVRKLDLSGGRTMYSRVAGVFLFAPFLAQMRLDRIAQEAGMAGTKMIPATSYLLSLLALKLLDKERKSHITDWNFDEALGLFAGLNVLPKHSAATDYSYRLTKGQHNGFIARWVKNAYPVLCPDGAREFALDLHPIPHRGDPRALENHYVPQTGKAAPSVQSFFARSVDSPMLHYADADIVRGEQDELPLHFIAYWKEITGLKPDWLYFDSKLTTYAVLSRLANEENINFITIRRRGARMVNKLLARPQSEWTRACIDTPQRRHQNILYCDERVTLYHYEGACRQVAVTGLGRQTPTLFLTNNEEETARNVVVRYIKRNAIENDLGINVNFFHLNCLASEVRLNVNLDVALTVMANGCYRWLSQQLKGYGKAEPKMLYRKFVETGGHITVEENAIHVRLDRRSHNPILAQAHLDKGSIEIPWLGAKRLQFTYA
jgi:hypothetical protein